MLLPVQMTKKSVNADAFVQVEHDDVLSFLVERSGDAGGEFRRQTRRGGVLRARAAFFMQLLENYRVKPQVQIQTSSKFTVRLSIQSVPRNMRRDDAGTRPSIDAPSASRRRTSVDETGAVGASTKKILGCGGDAARRFDHARRRVTAAQRAAPGAGEPGRETTTKWQRSRTPRIVLPGRDVAETRPRR